MKRALAFAALLACSSWIGEVRAAGVDLLLVLAADVSRSVDDSEFQLQRKGYAAALTDARVLKAIQGTKNGAIGVCFIEWSGEQDQKIVLPWTEIRDEEDSGGAAAAILNAPRSFTGRTSISAAIDFAMGYFGKAKWPAPRRIIDISGTAPAIRAVRLPRRATRRSPSVPQSTGWPSSTSSLIWGIRRTPTRQADYRIIIIRMLLAGPTRF